MKSFVFLLISSFLMISAQAIAIEPMASPTMGDETPIPEDAPATNPDLTIFPGEPPIPNEPIQAAVKVNVGSIGGAIDEAAIRTIKRVVGHAVANGTIGVYVITSPREGAPIPIEGGLSFCAETGFNTLESSYNEFVEELKSIQPQEGTFYNIRLADRCPVIIEDDDDVACTQDVKICPDGTGVGRLPPSCEFAPCPGEDPMPPSDEPVSDEASPPAEDPTTDGSMPPVEEPVPPTDGSMPPAEEPVPPTEQSMPAADEAMPPMDGSMPMPPIEKPDPITDESMPDESMPASDGLQ